MVVSSLSLSLSCAENKPQKGQQSQQQQQAGDDEKKQEEKEKFNPKELLEVRHCEATSISQRAHYVHLLRYGR